MNYQRAYLHMFNRLSDIISVLENVDSQNEMVNLLPILQAIQFESEEMCTAE